MFGSMNLYDNVAFPLREHTKKSESEIRNIVMEKMDLVGLLGAEDKLPGEISGGMRKRAGLARALVLDPEIVLFDEPDSGLDPVRTAFLNQLIIDLNAQIDATFLIVTHDVNTARTVPDNIGLLYHKHLAMFGPREMLLSLGGAGRPAVPQRPARRPDRHVGGEGRRRARGREGPGAAAAAADPVAAGAVQRHPPAQPAPARRVVPRERRDPAAGLLRAEHVHGAGGLTTACPLSLRTGSLPPSGRPASCSPSGSTSAVALFKRPFQMREFLQQAWFIASVTIVPTALVAIPFGAVIALQVGGLIKQFGAQSFTGSAVGARRGPRGGADRDLAADRRRRRLGHRGRPRRPQDPRRARRDDGARHRPDPATRRTSGARVHAGRGLPQRAGQRRRRRRRLLLQRGPPGRHAGRLPGQLHRARPAARPVAGHGQGAGLRADRRDRRVATRA